MVHERDARAIRVEVCSDGGVGGKRRVRRRRGVKF
jgi:hypothetical protein